jgi:hypothetical protein
LLAWTLECFWDCGVHSPFDFAPAIEVCKLVMMATTADKKEKEKKKERNALPTRMAGNV